MNNARVAKLYYFLILVVVPFVLFPFRIQTDNFLIHSLFGPSPYLDLFSISKIYVLALAALLGLALIKPNRWHIVLTLVFAWMMVKSLLSQNPSLAWIGGHEHRDGTLQWLVAFFVPLAVNQIPQERIGWILECVVWGSLLPAVFGLIQLAGWSLGDASFFKKIIPEIQYSIVWTHENIASTFYTPNYAGQYFAIVYAIALGLIVSKPSTWYMHIPSILALAGLIGSNCRSATFALLFFISLVLVFSRNRFLVIKIVFSHVAAACLLLFAANPARSLKLGRFQQIEMPKPKMEVEAIYESGDELVWKTDGTTLRISRNSQNEIVLKDAMGFPVPLRVVNKQVEFIDPRFQNLNLEIGELEKTKYLLLKINALVVKVWVLPDRFLIADEAHAKFDLFPARFGTGRGFIWNHTLDMVFECGFVGCEPGTYPVRFPQHDVIGRFNALDNTVPIVDKPHSIWLGALYNYGVPLFLFLVFLLFRILKAILHLKSKIDSNPKQTWLIGACFVYLASASFIDPFPSNIALFACLYSLFESQNA